VKRAAIFAAVALTWTAVRTTAVAVAQPMGPPAEQAIVRAEEKPEQLKNVGIDQRLNESLPLDAAFRDETGRAVHLGDYFGKRPVVLALVYYNCPMLCTQVLNGLVSALGVLTISAGYDFDVIAVSFDSRETPAMAAAKKEAYLARYRRSGAVLGWHFLTGDGSAIERLTKSIGFRFHFDEKIEQFAHASAVYVATPEGRLSHYFYGIEYAPRDLRLGLVEASAGRIGTPVDQILLYCFHYDPTRGKYGAAVIHIMRAAGILTVALIAVSIGIMSRRRRRQVRAAAAEGR
jgi:protein SCO1/2